MKPLFGFGNEDDFPWKYPRNLSFPAIQNASGSDSLEPGDSGDEAYNMDIEWATPHTPFDDTIIDEPTRYEITLRSSNGVQTADVTPRRTQAFSVIPDQQCDWSTLNRTSGEAIDSGSVTADIDSLLTVTGVEIHSGTGTRLVIDCP